MTAAAALTMFIERMKRERDERGLPPTITDESTLKVIAALVGRKGGLDERTADDVLEVAAAITAGGDDAA
jgi:hypothetical protein